MKKSREDLNRDLKEIAAATRIKESFLRAIENEQYDKLPLEVYARGYIKVYAKYLGIDFDTALQPYEKYLEIKAGPKEKKLVPVQNEVDEQSPDENEHIDKITAVPSLFSRKADEPLFADAEDKSASTPWYYSPRYIWKGIFLVVVLCIVIIIQLVALGGSRKAATNNKTVSSQTEMKKAEPQKQDQQVSAATQKQELQTAQITPSSNPKAVETAKPQTDPAQTRKRHVLVLTATEKAWIQVTLDGKDKKEAMMEPGETLTYEASRSITGIVGNGGGVKMKFNGKQLPSGKRGEVQYLNFPDNNPTAQAPSANSTSIKPDRANQPPSSRQL